MTFALVAQRGAYEFHSIVARQVRGGGHGADLAYRNRKLDILGCRERINVQAGNQRGDAE